MRGTGPPGGSGADAADGELRRRRPSAEKLQLLVLVTATVAGLLLVAAGVSVALDPPGDPFRYLVLVAVGTLLADATLIDLRVGRHVESYTWAEVNVVLGLALLAPENLVLTSLALAISCLVTGRSTMKVLHNTAAHTVAVALAALATRAVAVPSWERPVLSGVALGVGVLVFFVCNTLLIKAAIALVQELPFWSVSCRNAGMLLLVMVGNALVAGCALVVGHTAMEVLLAVPVALTVAYVAYRGHLRVLSERKVWQHLEATSREMGGLDEREIAEVAIVRAAHLLEADEIEVCLYRGAQGPDEVHVGGAEGRRTVSSETRQQADRFAVTTYRPSDAASGSGDETCVLVPLLGRQDQIGLLRVRFRAQVDLSRREQQLLATYGHAVSAALDNARLYAAVREQAARHQQAALHDPLTGLGNRAMLREQAAAAVADRGSPFALLLLDLDRFKEVNDVHGHAAGDTLLCTVAERMRGAVRATDLVARLGGDEFAVLLRDLSAVERTVARLSALLQEPVDIGGHVVTIGASIGVARFPDDATTMEGLLGQADEAMYGVKASRRASRGQLLALPTHGPAGSPPQAPRGAAPQAPRGAAPQAPGHRVISVS